MRKPMLVSEPHIPAVDWITRLGKETGAFDVLSVVLGKSSDQARWSHSVTISFVEPNQGKVALIVETKKQLTPKTVISIAERRHWLPPDSVLLVCCPFIPARVAEVLKEQKISYIDQAGNCLLVTSGLFLHIQGRPNRSTAKTTSIDPFSKKSSRIIRTLLSEPNAEWQVQQLAKESKVSIGLTSKVKQLLVEEAYLEERNRLLNLRVPEKLLKDWSKAYQPQATPLQIFCMYKAPQSEKSIAQWCEKNDIPYALTQLAAAWRYSPMVRYERSVIYIDKAIAVSGKLSDLLNCIEAKEVDTGANCTLWLTDDSAVFVGAKRYDGVNVVSPIQLYLDLKSLPGRGEEAADEIYEKELRMLMPTKMSL